MPVVCLAANHLVCVSGGQGLDSRRIYALTPSGIVDVFPEFLERHHGIDGVDVVDARTIAFSVDNQGGGSDSIRPENIYLYDIRSRTVRVGLDWQAWNISPGNLCALDVLTDGSFAFVVEDDVQLTDGRGTPIQLLKQNAYQVRPGTGAITKIFDGVAIGLSKRLDALDLRSSQRIAFSTDQDDIARVGATTVSLNKQNVYTYDKTNGSISLAVDGASLGLQRSLDFAIDTSLPVTLVAIQLGPAAAVLTPADSRSIPPTQNRSRGGAGSGERSSVQLKTTGTYLDNSTRDLTGSSTGTDYESSDPSVVTVSPGGKVTAVGKGSATVTAFNFVHRAQMNVIVAGSLVRGDLAVVGESGSGVSILVFPNDGAPPAIRLRADPDGTGTMSSTDVSVSRNLIVSNKATLESLVVPGSATLHAASATSLSVNGTTRTGVLEITGGADIAEPFATADTEQLKEGMVVVIDERQPGSITLSTSPYDRRVVGVVSGAGGIEPGLSLSQIGIPEQSRRVALAGRVYTLCDVSNGAIHPGDLLTTSKIPGQAMRATDRVRAQGAVIGKALSSLTEGTGLVLILVNPQ